MSGLRKSLAATLVGTTFLPLSAIPKSASQINLKSNLASQESIWQDFVGYGDSGSQLGVASVQARFGLSATRIFERPALIGESRLQDLSKDPLIQIAGVG